MLQFRKVRPDDLELILQWRTKPEVTRFMNTDIEFNLERQKQWYERVIRDSSEVLYWVICQDDRPIGVLNLSDYDRYHGRTSWGYYIGELDCWQLGGLIPPYFYNYLFFERDKELKKITAEVLAPNQQVIKMHLFHGYREVGTQKGHIRKGNEWYDNVVLELTRESWMNQAKKFGHYLAKFEE